MSAATVRAALTTAYETDPTVGNVFSNHPTLADFIGPASSFAGCSDPNFQPLGGGDPYTAREGLCASLVFQLLEIYHADGVRAFYAAALDVYGYLSHALPPRYVAGARQYLMQAAQ